MIRTEEVSRSGRSRRWRRVMEDETVPVTVGEPLLFRLFGKRAARPTLSVRDIGTLRRLEIGAPGANASNTEVIWDAAARQLSVGVWCRRPRTLKVPMSLPLPELCWHRSMHLPAYDGARARVRVRHGKITMEIPAIAAQAPAPEVVGRRSEAPSAELPPNVSVLPARRGGVRANAGAETATSPAQRPTASATTRRWLGVAACLTLCTPMLFFTFTFFGVVLLPLLPLLGVILLVPVDDRPPAPPVRPQLPSAGAATPTRPIEYAEAA